MARGRKKAAVEKTVKLHQSELKRAIEDASRQKADAAQYSGFHGRTVQTFCERSSFDRTVFGWLRKLYDLGDDLKRQSMIRQFLMGVDLLDFQAQGDLFSDLKDDLANKVQRDGANDAEDEEDLRPAFLQNAMPLNEAEAAFKKTEHLAPQPDALSALAGEDDGFGAATAEIVGEADPDTVAVTKGGRRTRVPKAELEAAAKAGKAEVRGIGDVVLN